jgi:hypothetical protein
LGLGGGEVEGGSEWGGHGGDEYCDCAVKK